MNNTTNASRFLHTSSNATSLCLDCAACGDTCDSCKVDHNIQAEDNILRTESVLNKVQDMFLMVETEMHFEQCGIWVGEESLTFSVSEVHDARVTFRYDSVPPNLGEEFVEALEKASDVAYTDLMDRDLSDAWSCRALDNVLEFV